MRLPSRNALRASRSITRSPTRNLRRLVLAAAARQRLQSRQQLHEGKRLDQIVVGARAQPLDAILDAVARGKHDHRRVLDRAQRPQHRQAVEAGQHLVEHDHVVVDFERKVLRVEPVVRQVDAAALLGEPLVEVVRYLQLVFDHEDLHGSIPSATQHRCTMAACACTPHRPHSPPVGRMAPGARRACVLRTYQLWARSR